jgi:hypothetical protein
MSGCTAVRLNPVLARLRAHWQFKLFVGGLITTAFFAVYLVIQWYPRFPVTVMPAIFLDRWISFRPNTVLLYLSLWLYIPVGSWLLDRKQELNA